MSDEQILENMVLAQMELGYSRQEAIQEVNDLYLTTLMHEPNLN